MPLNGILNWSTLTIIATCCLLQKIEGDTILVESSPNKKKKHDTSSPKDDEKSPPPHILFILVDDLGWGDVGFHQTSREVQTPVMDQLVREGMELNRHYVHSSCTGTRTALQSGRFPVHVQTSLKNPEDPSSGMPRNWTGLAEHMSSYATHYVGKWDVGMATPKHTPQGRGYDTSLNYFEHKNDYWTQECAQSVCCNNHMQERASQEVASIRSDSDSAATNSPHQGSSKAFAGVRKKKKKIIDLWDTDRPARSLAGTDYEEFIFQRRMLDIIDQHAATNSNSGTSEQKPLFLFYAPHVAHCPLQVPQSYLDEFAFMDADGTDEKLCKEQTANILGPNHTHDAPPYSCRKQYHAMVKLVDDIIGSLVDRLKHHLMWENTVLVLTSDNGGPTGPDESAATNYPLRGGKYSDWEGGVRATAFVSGGFLPPNRRGKILQEPIHICDWYATLPGLAGVDVRQGESKNNSKIPPLDARDVWDLIVGDSGDTDNVVGKDDSATMTKDPRGIPLSEDALIVGDYKLLWNKKANISMAGWTYPDYPNKKTPRDEIQKQTVNCSTGCLFNVATDPGEHYNIATQEPVRVQALKKRLLELRKNFFQNDDRGVDSCPHNDTSSLPCACWMAINYYGGFFGPYQEVDIYARTSVGA